MTVSPNRTSSNATLLVLKGPGVSQRSNSSTARGIRDGSSRTPAPEIARAVYTTALDLGLRTSVGGHIIRLAPPFTMDEALLDEGVRLLERAIELAVEQVPE